MPERQPEPQGIDWAALWRRGQRGWPQSFPLAQFPNPPLLVYLAAILVERASPGHLHDWAWAASRMALTVWGYEEAVHGVNWFRRCLGIVVLAGVAAGLVSDLG